MDENGNGHKPQSSTTLVITITWDQVTGQFGVNGHIQHELIALGMLQKAVVTIADHHKQQASKILVATPNVNLRM